MLKQLKKIFEERMLYPVISGFHIALGIEGILEVAKETTVFPCRPVTIGTQTVNYMSANHYSYEPEFAQEVLVRLVERFPQLNGRVKILNVWTPATYDRYCKSVVDGARWFIDSCF